MSLKDGKKGTGTNERIAVGSGERRGGTGERVGGRRWKCARGSSEKEKRVARGARPVGRYFCACFVFNFSPPFARRGAASAPRRTIPRRDARQRSRGAGWCAVVLVRMHISVPHILIQGVITRLSSAHSHHCLNHPPPPSSSSRQSRFPSPADPSLGPSPSSTFFTSSHHRPPVALLRRPDHPIYPARTFTTPQLEESSCRPVLLYPILPSSDPPVFIA